MKHSTFLALAASILILSNSISASAQKYSGKIFIDANGNEKCDAGEKVMAGVAVSDGLNVTQSDSEGNFTLPGFGKERFIFITTPSGYMTYNAYYKRINLEQKTYDFGVIPYENHISKDGSHRFIQLSDSEIGGISGNEDWSSEIREYTENENISFVIHTGDICYEKGLKSHIQLMNTRNMQIPMYYCIGNHDLVAGEYGEKLFEDLYGPVFYSFDVGSVHYIVTPMSDGDYAPSYTKDDVCAWLKNDLAHVKNGTPIIVFNHTLPIYDDQFIFKGESGDSVNLDAHNLKAWIYGHWHVNHLRKHGSAYSVSTACPNVAGIGHASTSFREFNIDGEGNFSSSLRYTYWDKQIKISSICGHRNALNEDGTVPFRVSAYCSTTPTKSVIIKLSDDKHRIFKYSTLYQKSDFGWSADIRIPKKYSGKILTATATATFRNGEKVTRTETFVYTPKEKTNTEKANGGEWTNLCQNARHMGIAKEALKLPLELAWTTNVENNIYMTSPVISGNRLFIATVDEDGKNRAAIWCLDAIDGKVIWKYPVKASIRNTIALESGNVYAQDVLGNLYAVNQKTGLLIWKKELNIDVLPELMEGLATADGIVYAGSGKGLCALDCETGKELWRNNDWGQHEACSATLGVNGDVVIGSSHWQALYANDLKTGEMLWELKEDGLRNRSASPAMIGDNLYIISRENIFEIEARSGKILRKKNLGYNVDVASTPLVTENKIIFGTSDNGIIAINRSTLEKIWNFETKTSLIFSSPYTRQPSKTVETSPVLSGNTVFFSASDGNIYGVDVETGRLKWMHETGTPCFGSVTLAGDFLYAVDFAGNVYGFRQSAE